MMPVELGAHYSMPSWDGLVASPSDALLSRVARCAPTLPSPTMMNCISKTIVLDPSIDCMPADLCQLDKGWCGGCVETGEESSSTSTGDKTCPAWLEVIEAGWRLSVVGDPTATEPAWAKLAGR